MVSSYAMVIEKQFRRTLALLKYLKEYQTHNAFLSSEFEASPCFSLQSTINYLCKMFLYFMTIESEK